MAIEEQLGRGAHDPVSAGIEVGAVSARLRRSKVVVERNRITREGGAESSGEVHLVDVARRDVVPNRFDGTLVGRSIVDPPPSRQFVLAQAGIRSWVQHPGCEESEPNEWQVGVDAAGPPGSHDEFRIKRRRRLVADIPDGPESGSRRLLHPGQCRNHIFDRGRDNLSNLVREHGGTTAVGPEIVEPGHSRH